MASYFLLPALYDPPRALNRVTLLPCLHNLRVRRSIKCLGSLFACSLDNFTKMPTVSSSPPMDKFTQSVIAYAMMVAPNSLTLLFDT